MRHSLLLWAVAVATGCTIGLPPPDLFPSGTCRSSVAVGEVALARSSCVVYEPYRNFGVLRSGASGDVRYDCHGSYAEVTLAAPGAEAGQTAQWFLVGTHEAGRVELAGSRALSSAHECTWESSAHISGSLAEGALTYAYEERLVTSPPGDCLPGCVATAVLRIR